MLSYVSRLWYGGEKNMEGVNTGINGHRTTNRDDDIQSVNSGTSEYQDTQTNEELPEHVDRENESPSGQPVVTTCQETQTDVESREQKEKQRRDTEIRNDTISKQEQPSAANMFGGVVKTLNRLEPEIAVTIAHANDLLHTAEQKLTDFAKTADELKQKGEEFLTKTDGNIEGIKDNIEVAINNIGHAIGGLLGTPKVFLDLEKTLGEIKEFFNISYLTHLPEGEQQYQVTDGNRKQITIFEDNLKKIRSDLDTLALSAESDQEIIEQCALIYKEKHPNEKIDLLKRADKEKIYKEIFLAELENLLAKVELLRQAITVTENHNEIRKSEVRILLLQFYQVDERGITLEEFKLKFYNRTRKTIKQVGDLSEKLSEVCEQTKETLKKLNNVCDEGAKTVQRLRPDNEKATFFLFAILGQGSGIAAIIMLKRLIDGEKCCPKELIETWAILALFCFGFIFSAYAHRKTERAGFQDYQGFFLAMVPGLLIAGAGVLYILRIFEKAPESVLKGWNNETLLCIASVGVVVGILVLTGLFYGLSYGVKKLAEVINGESNNKQVNNPTPSTDVSGASAATKTPENSLLT
jgi:uncharacterized protein YoxC